MEGYPNGRYDLREALKAFRFVSISFLVFKKKQKQKRNRMILLCFGFVTFFHIDCFGQVTLFIFASINDLPGFCFVSVSFLWTLGQNLKMAGICHMLMILRHGPPFIKY